jgi:hypothetical protein
MFSFGLVLLETMTLKPTESIYEPITGHLLGFIK